MRGHTVGAGELSLNVRRQRAPSSDLAVLGHLLPQGEKDESYPLNAASKASAASREDAGFWPVISFPSTWMNEPQSGPLA